MESQEINKHIKELSEKIQNTDCADTKQHLQILLQAHLLLNEVEKNITEMFERVEQRVEADINKYLKAKLVYFNGMNMKMKDGSPFPLTERCERERYENIESYSIERINDLLNDGQIFYSQKRFCLLTELK